MCNNCDCSNQEMMGMTMMPVYKRCPICLRKYSWNPDIGQLWCPYCGKKGIPGIEELPLKILKKTLWKRKE